MSDVYSTEWYAKAIDPAYRIYDDGANRFFYVERGDECVSIYGYPGISGDAAVVRACLGKPLFIRHRVDYQGEGLERATRVIPCADPWLPGSPHLKEAARAERLGIIAKNLGSDAHALTAFKRDYFTAMDNKCASEKFYVLAERLEQWADNPQVHVVATDGAAALFLTGKDWAHYHLSYRLPGAHNTAMHAIFATAVPMIAALGCQHIHLGGGTTASLTDPLYLFKSRIGRLPWSVRFQEIP